MKTQKRTRSPLWSVRAIALISVPVVLTTLLLVFWLSNRSFVQELSITLGVIAVVLFIFLTVGLYHGVHLERPFPATIETPIPASLDAGAIGVPIIAPPKLDLDIPNLGDGGDDLVGCLLSIVLWIAITILLMFLFWLFVQFLALVLPWLLLALYWIFYRALRIVFVKGRMCRGNITSSLGYGLLFTALYTGWMFLLLAVLEIIRTWRPA